VAAPALLSSKRWLIVAASIIVLGVILVALSTLDFHWPRVIVASGEPLAVSAQELRADFQRDPKQARRHYVGRELTVTGIVLSVPFSFDKTGATEWEYVVTSAAADPNEFPWISCRVPKQDNPPPWPVELGDTVTIRGVCFNATNSGVLLQNCKLIRHEPAKAK
jgi:hypothetical protein